MKTKFDSGNAVVVVAAFAVVVVDDVVEVDS